MEAAGAGNQAPAAGEPEPSAAATRGNGASSDDSVRTSSSSSILKVYAPRQMSDDGGSSSADTEAAGGPPPRRGGQRRRRRLAFGRVTTHPFDTMEPSSLRFDHAVTISEASADRWESFLRPAAAVRRRRGQAHHPAGAARMTHSTTTEPQGWRIEPHISRWAAEGMPHSPRRTSSVNALLGILDQVSLLTSDSPSSPPEADLSKPQGSLKCDDDEAFFPEKPRTPPSPEVARPAVGRRPRGIEPLPADLLRAASDTSSLDEEDPPLISDERPLQGVLVEGIVSPASPRGGGADNQQSRWPRKERSVSLANDGPSAAPHPLGEVSRRVAPPRQVGRRGSTLHAFLRDPLHRHRNAAAEEEKEERSQTRGALIATGPATGEDGCPREESAASQGGTASLLLPTDGGKVQESTGSTQESDSEDDAAAISAGMQMETPSRFHFKSPMLRRRVGVRSSVRHAGANASNDDEARGDGRPNRSSMVTNLPSRTFSLAPANPCYRAKDGLQSTHRSAGKSSSFRRWTLVSILPSRKSRSSPSLVSQ
jgi:hypothetical protein